MMLKYQVLASKLAKKDHGYKITGQCIELKICKVRISDRNKFLINHLWNFDQFVKSLKFDLFPIGLLI